MTYNIWNYNRPWRRRRELIASLITSHEPDVVCLQETRHDWRFERGKGQGEQIAALTGYHPTFAVGQVYFPWPRVDEGLTILTREPPERVMARQLTRMPHERGDGNQRVCLGVAVRPAGAELHVYDAHFSLSARARVSNAREVLDFVRTESGDRPAMLMGDLNGYPDTPPIQFLIGSESIDGDTGDFADCWNVANPGDPGFTYSPWEPDHRIDYALVRNLSGRVASARLVGTESKDGVYPSDHIGVLVDLEL